MKQYITNGGGAFANFAEVVDYLKNTNHSVLLKDMPSFRAALLRNSDGQYRFKVFLIGKDFNAYYSFETEFARLTKKNIAMMEKVMDDIADDYMGKDYRLTYTETLGGNYDEPVVLAKREWIGSYADFEAFKNNFEMTANLWIDKKLYANECQVLLRDDPNDASKVLDNQKCLVTYYYDGKWNRVVRKIVCEKLV